MARNGGKVDLLTGSPGKKIIMFAVPLLIGNLFQEMYNAVDTLVVGRFEGSMALGAVGAAGVPFMLINALSIGFSVGATILIGQFYGARGGKELKKICGTVLVMSVLLGIGITALNYFLCYPLLRLLNVTDTLIGSSHTYLVTIGWFLVPMILYNNVSGMLRGIGNARMPLVFLIICTIINTILDVLFVAVFHMGVFGVALATGIAQLISAVLVIVYVYLRVPELAPGREELRIDGPIFRKTVRLGLPNAVQMSAVMLGIIVLQRIINSFGDLVIAAYAVGAKINNFLQMPVISLSSTVSTYVAQNLGANEHERIRKGVRFTMLFAIGISVFFSALIVIFRHQLIGIFTTAADTEVIRIGGQYLVIFAAPFFLMAINNIMQGTMNGGGDTVFTMIASIFMTFLRVPLAYFFTGTLGMDYRGAWLAFPVSWVIWIVILFIRYRSGKWKKAVVGKAE